MIKRHCPKQLRWAFTLQVTLVRTLQLISHPTGGGRLSWPERTVGCLRWAGWAYESVTLPLDHGTHRPCFQTADYQQLFGQDEAYAQ